MSGSAMEELAYQGGDIRVQPAEGAEKCKEGSKNASPSLESSFLSVLVLWGWLCDVGIATTDGCL